MNRILEIQACEQCMYLVHGKTKWLCEVLAMEIKSDVSTQIPKGCPLPPTPDPKWNGLGFPPYMRMLEDD